MDFLRITATNGTRTMIPKDALIQVTTAADATGAVTDNASGRVTRGIITGLKYLDGAAAASPTIVVVVVAAYAGNNDLYELGCLSPDGAFQTTLSNRVVNY
jgi:hypothetical protein